MRFMLKFLLVFSAAAFLGACDTVKGWTKGSGAADQEISVTNSAAEARLDGAPGVRPIPQFSVPDNRDLKLMTSKLSGGSVEIYDLEGEPAIVDSGIPPVQQDYNGIPLATDPRVTVYPVDGYAAPQGGYGGGMWPNAVLPVAPVGHAGMTPPPASFGGDRAMNIEGGKLSSRAGQHVSNIYFPYGSAQVQDDAVLDQVAQAAKFAPVDRVTVEGHASVPTQTNDPVKAKILNLKESVKRAAAVSEGLIEKGVPAEKIKTVGWGDTKQTAGGEAEQRRVDVFTGAGP